MSKESSQTAEQLRLENAKLKELMHQAERVRVLYEKALEKIRKVETSLSESNAMLSKNEERLELAFMVAKQAWFDLDVQTGEAVLSPEYALTFGYDPAEFDKSLQNWKENLHPEDREKALAAFDACLATGGPATLEYRRRTKDGGWKWLLSVARVVEWDDAQKPLRMVGIHMDISDRKAMESALLASEEQYRLLFENSGEAILLAGPDGSIYSANPAACRMFGRSQEELIGVGRPGIVDESDPAIQAALAARGKNGLFRGELTMLRSDGSGFPVELSSVNFTDSHGNKRLSLMIRDISERKRHEVLLQAHIRLSESDVRDDYHQLMRLTLDIAEEMTGSKIGFFHFVDKNQKTISLQDWSTNTVEKMCTAQATGMNYKLNEAGVWADAIRKKVPVVHNDYPHLDDRKGMPEGHAVIEREICVPILREGRVVAAIGIGNKPFDYVEADVEALTQLANLAWDIIEARKSEIRLHDNERRYEALFQSAADYALVLEYKDGKDFPIIVDANDAALAKHGYTREEMIGKPISLIDNKVKAEDSDEIIRQLMMGKPIHFEMEHTCKDGSTFLVESSSNLVGAAGESKLFYSVERDITQRKRIEEAMQRAEAELLEAQRIAHVGSWQLDVATNRVFWSEELYKMYGYDPGLPPPSYTESAKLFTTESWEKLDAALRHTRETGIPYALELEYIRPDGSHGWMLARGEAQRDAGGAVSGLHGIAMDITERKKAEALLKRRVDELERFTKAAVRREFRIKELKDQLENLKSHEDERL